MSNNYRIQCIVCNKTINTGDNATHRLDPCSLTIASNIEYVENHQKTQTFFTHFECFRQIVNNDSVLYIQDPDFSTTAEAEHEIRTTEDLLATVLLEIESIPISELIEHSKGTWREIREFSLSKDLESAVDALESFTGESTLIAWTEDIENGRRVQKAESIIVLASTDSNHDFIDSQVVFKSVTNKIMQIIPE